MIIAYNSVTHVSEHLLPFSPVYTPVKGEGTRSHLMICKKSPNRNCILPISKEIRDIMVYPNVAPKNIIRNQVPTLAVAPNHPLCSLEKKK